MNHSRFTQQGKLASHWTSLGFPSDSGSREPACNAEDVGSTPGSGRSPAEENGYPLQYCCLENPMDREAWWATVHGVAKSQTWLRLFTLDFTIPHPRCGVSSQPSEPGLSAGKITVLVSNRTVSSLLSNLPPILVPSSHLPLLILSLLLDWEKTFTLSALQIYLHLCCCPFFPSFGSWANSFLSCQGRSFLCFPDLIPAWDRIPSQVVCSLVFPYFIFNFPFPHFLKTSKNHESSIL